MGDLKSSPNVLIALQLFKMFGIGIMAGTGSLKRVVWYFEEGCIVLRRGWCGTLKRW